MVGYRQASKTNLYNVIAAKTKALSGILYAIGGIENHIHFVASIPPALALDRFIGQVKGHSSYFVNAEYHPEIPFAWQ